MMPCSACEPDYCSCRDYFGGRLEFHQTNRIVEAIHDAGLCVRPQLFWFQPIADYLKRNLPLLIKGLSEVRALAPGGSFAVHVQQLRSTAPPLVTRRRRLSRRIK